MSLTYQPFAEVPQLDEMAEELHMNVSNNERLGSAAAAIALLAFAVRQWGISRWAALLTSGSLLWRSASGHCAMYDRLGKDTRHGSV